jgi:multidrug transporter EmrE-like cation transporter
MMPIFEMPRCCSSTLAAKVITVFVTSWWSINALFKTDALAREHSRLYESMNTIANENVWASLVLVLCFIGALTWVSRRIPMAVVTAVYGTLAIFWIYLTASVYYLYSETPPTLFPLVGTITGVAVFAFLSRDGNRSAA